VICRSCERENKIKAQKAAVEYSARQRRRAFGWGGLAAAVMLGVGLFITFKDGFNSQMLIGTLILPVLLFTLISCLFLKNNFVGDMIEEISLWGAVRFPGLIFSFDLGGIAWLIGMKILFWVIGFLIGAAAIALAISVGLIVSPFVYPFALSKSINLPEETDLT